MTRLALALPLACLAAVAAHAQAPAPSPSASPSPPPETKVDWGAFVDTYYAWDFNRPAEFDRAYTTQPARHAEFNVNLAYVEARLQAPRVRGRLALQYGTSVQANYAGEPHIGSISGPDVSRYIQEATVGYQISPSVWLDGGIFLSHLGYEGWISRDNLTYTRSMVAEFSPYYEAGAKLTWTISPRVTGTVAVLNGWQDISVYNSPPAGGIRLDWAPTSNVTLSYDNFVGNAAADADPVKLRLYHDLIVQVKAGNRWQLAGVLSYGRQTKSDGQGGTATWWGGSAMAKLQATPRLAVVGRVETYSDPHQVIVVTGLPDSFKASGASIGVDLTLARRVLWRTEFRGFVSPRDVWPTNEKGVPTDHDTFAATSLAVTF
jgi:hypothetical protein